MKIDRFVKVMLVLITLLLALNSAKDLKQYSGSNRSSNILSSLDILQPSPVEAQSRVRWEYFLTKEVGVTAKDLNTLGEAGWEIATMNGGQVILKRRKN